MTVEVATPTWRRGAWGAAKGDLSTIAGARTVAYQVNKIGHFDGIIHNAGIGYRQTRRMEPELKFPASSPLM
jgi:hypothetical protein